MAEALSQFAQRAQSCPAADVYGRGELIENFEKKMALLLGKPAALFIASGTLAQPMALKIHSERKGKTAVAMHPTSHLVLHEQDGVQKLWGLRVVLTGNPDQVVSLADLQKLPFSDLAAVLLELPMREIGGQLPHWEELQAQVQWARCFICISRTITQ